jgi:hypothetical protein
MAFSAFGDATAELVAPLRRLDGVAVDSPSNLVARPT